MSTVYHVDGYRLVEHFDTPCNTREFEASPQHSSAVEMGFSGKLGPEVVGTMMAMYPGVSNMWVKGFARKVGATEYVMLPNTQHSDNPVLSVIYQDPETIRLLEERIDEIHTEIGRQYHDYLDAPSIEHANVIRRLSSLTDYERVDVYSLPSDTRPEEVQPTLDVLAVDRIARWKEHNYDMEYDQLQEIERT